MRAFDDDDDPIDDVFTIFDTVMTFILMIRLVMWWYSIDISAMASIDIHCYLFYNSTDV